VFAGAAGLAGVVEEQSEQEKIEAIDFRKQLCEALLVIVDGLAEEVDVINVRKVCSSTV
jgi:hypothetical protein